MTTASSTRWVGPDPADVAPASGAPAPERAARYLALIEKVTAQLLAAADPARMVRDLFALIQAELRLDVFINFRFDGQRLLLEAHGGLTADEAASVAVIEMGQAVCGCVARDRVPIHAVAVQRSEEPMVSFVRGLGIDAYACTPLVQASTLIGTLSFGRRWAERFDEDELRLLQTICHYVALAKHRLRVENELRQALEARERMLQELNHRVRNALQIVIGILSLESRGAVSEEAKDAINHARDRILVVAAVHQRLYGSAGLTGIAVGGLLADLIGDLGHGAGRAMSFTREGELILPIEIAVTLALAVDQILRDRGGSGPVRITLTGHDDGSAVIAFAGLGRSRAASERVLTALLRQLRATLAEDPVPTLIIPASVAPGAQREIAA